MLKKALLVASCAALLLAGIFVYQIFSSLSDFGIDTNAVIVDEYYQQRIDQSKRQNTGHRNDRATADDPVDHQTPQPEHYYVLVIGLDTRGDVLTLNTDSIHVAHIIPEVDSIKLLSIPRDTRVSNTRGEDTKINAVFAEGYQYARSQAMKRPELLSGKTIRLGDFNIAEEYVSSGMVVLRETVEEYLDIDIDYTFLINFQTVVSLVDFVGGIEIDVERDMYWQDNADGTHIHFEKGLQLLDGEQALNYARFRKDLRGEEYDSNDFERGARQQKIMVTLLEQLNSWNNITKISEILDIVTANVKTDMPRSTMLSMANKLYGNISSSNVESIPFPGNWGGRYVDIEPEDLERIKQQFSSIGRISRADTAKNRNIADESDPSTRAEADREPRT